MNTASMSLPSKNAQPSLKQAAKDMVSAGATMVRRAIISVTAKRPNERPAIGTYEASVESLDLLDTMMKVPNTDTMEPVVRITLIVEHANQKYRLYYRNPVSYAMRDFPRLRGYYEVGGLMAITENPALLKKLGATIEVDYNGKDNEYTNVRIVGASAYSPAQKKKLSALAAAMGEAEVPQAPKPEVIDVPAAQ